MLLLAGAAPSRSISAAARTRTLTAKVFSEVKSFREIEWPQEFPFANPQYFARADESDDGIFYAEPRLVKHIDDGAIASLSEFYASSLKEGSDVCDLCSSWISHLPDEPKLGRVVGVGMNSEELSRNARLTEALQQDLNENPTLPFNDASFDYVLNAVSVDYLTKPIEIFREMHRILRPGGKAIMSFSNRCFPTKAIAIWGQTDDSGHIWIVGSYYQYSSEWSDVCAYDISAGGGGDPMFVVQGTK